MTFAKLKSLFDFQPKSHIKAGEGKDKGSYPFYTSSDIQSKHIDNYLYEPGCLVFGTGGKPSVHFATTRFSTSTDCIITRPRPDGLVEAAYAFHYFKNNMHILEKGFKGAGLKHISKTYIANIPIPLQETTDDQLRIALLLGKIQNLIGRRKSHLTQIDDLVTSIFIDMFGNPVQNAKGWSRTELKHFGTISTGNTPPKKDPINYSDRHIEWIKTDNIISDSVYVTQAVEFLSEAGKTKGRTVDNGALLVACIAGSLDSIGRAALTKRTVAFNQQINAIQPNDEINPIFLYYLFKLSKSHIQSYAAKGMKKILTKGVFENIKMIKPPFDLQNRFAVIADKVEAIKSRYQNSLSDLEALYGALSQKAFKGELDLSRIVLSAEHDETAGEIGKGETATMATETAQIIDLSTPDNSLIKVLDTPEGRKATIELWLNEYLNQLDSTCSFSAQEFMKAAQRKLWELNQDGLFEPDDESCLELGVAEYDQLANRLFDELKRGRLKQVFDDNNNQVKILAQPGA